MSTPEALLRWYGLLLLLSVAFAPWVRLLCDRLPDRGASITRPVAMLGTIFPAWFLAGFGLIPYSPVGLWTTIAVAGIAGWAVVARARLIDRGWLRAVTMSEVLAVAVFLVYVWLRGFTPNIDITEKPMDMAFLSASERTEAIPPNDPWYAGETINYYYLGYLIHGSVSRLSGVPPEIGFNLALATTGSAAFVAAVGLAFNLVRRWGTRRMGIAAGAIAAFLIVVAGNMLAPARLIAHGSVTVEADWWDQSLGVGWRSARIVCDGPRLDGGGKCDTASGSVETITESPSFSLLFGDLHPHVMALPFTVMALSLAFALLLFREEVGDRQRRWLYLRCGAIGAMIGSLYALNSWDYPTYLFVGFLAGAVGLWHRGLRERLTAAAVYVLSSVVAWVPFYLHFAAPVGGASDTLPGLLRDIPLVSTALRTLAPVRGERTSGGEFLTVFGMTYAVALVLLVSGYWRRSSRRDDDHQADAGSATWSVGQLWPVLVLLVLVGIALPAPILLLAGIPAILLGAQAVAARSDDRGIREIAAALFALGLLLVVATDLFYIQDSFASRMNTVFKVYYQAWTLFGIAAAAGLIAIWREFAGTRLRAPLFGAVGVIGLTAGLAYPLIAYNQWTDGYRDWQTLDGLAYIDGANSDERAAIDWVAANLGPDDVILEAAGCSYGNSYSTSEVRHNRVSAFTGVPTVIGWDGHESQWRRGQPEHDTLRQRANDVRAMYQDPSSNLYEVYGVDYLYVGTLERTGDRDCALLADPYAGPDSPDYPGPGWEVAFESGAVAIYRRSIA